MVEHKTLSGKGLCFVSVTSRAARGKIWNNRGENTCFSVDTGPRESVD